MSETLKIASVLLESAKETHEEQNKMVDLTSYEQPDGAKMQDSSNVIWRPYQQHRPIIDGWDLTGLETDIIEQGYPAVLGTPKNDFIKQRADQMRNMIYWERAGKESGRRQVAEQNKLIAQAIMNQGSQFYRSNVTSGYDFIAEGQAILNETQQAMTNRYFMMNDRDNLKFSKDLAGRQTVQGRPESVWATGQIGNNIAEFDVFTGSFLPNLVGGASPDTTVTGDQSFAPLAGTVTNDNLVTNNDARKADIPVAASASYNVGDKVQFLNGATAVESIGLMDKSATGQPMTFTIVAKPDATTITVFPRPIALDDAGLTTLEKAYANINTQILNLAVVSRVNVDASAKVNLFWDQSAVEVLGGTVPAQLMQQYDGMQVITSTMSNGQEMYMVYDGKIEDMSFRYRLFTWYGITLCRPEAAGVAVTY